jgi:hypothetical protein
VTRFPSLEQALDLAELATGAPPEVRDLVIAVADGTVADVGEIAERLRAFTR